MSKLYLYNAFFDQSFVFFENKILFFFELGKSSNFAVECFFCLKCIISKVRGKNIPVVTEHLVILRHIEYEESKIFLSNRCVFLTRCLPIELALNEPTSVVHVSECEFFSSNCSSKFAVECD